MHDNVANGADNACQVLIEKSAVSWKANEGDYRDDVSSLVFCFSLLPCPALLSRSDLLSIGPLPAADHRDRRCPSYP